eukprot:1146678-Pelagomonas_calceolata.AAC.6
MSAPARQQWFKNGTQASAVFGQLAANSLGLPSLGAKVRAYACLGPVPSLGAKVRVYACLGPVPSLGAKVRAYACLGPDQSRELSQQRILTQRPKPFALAPH